MSKCKDMTGKRFGMATVIARVQNNNQGEAMWNCLCDCGNTFVTSGSRIRFAVVKSCGCYMAISASRQFKTHGMSSKRIYYIWSSMKARCNNENCKEYKYYGARGITICEEWLVAENFINWAYANGYADNLTLERINNEGCYEPSNCAFIELRMQGRNTRRVIRITTLDGYMSATETAAALGVSSSTIARRYHAGLIKTFDDAKRVARRGWKHE